MRDTNYLFELFLRRLSIFFVAFFYFPQNSPSSIKFTKLLKTNYPKIYLFLSILKWDLNDFKFRLN